MEERRNHPRLAFATQVWVEHEWIGRGQFATTDISDSGSFLEMADHPFKGGEKIILQVCDVEDAPLLAAIVVRITDQGVGIAFADEEIAG